MSLYNEDEYINVTMDMDLLQEIYLLQCRINELEEQTDKLYEENAMLKYAIEELKE